MGSLLQEWPLFTLPSEVHQRNTSLVFVVARLFALNSGLSANVYKEIVE